MSDTTRMEITPEQYALIEDCLPRQRGNVSLSNLDVLNAILYVAEHGCKWRGLPKRFGRWHTIYTRMNRWAKAGVLDRVFTALQEEELIRIKVETLALDSTIVKVHPDGTGAEKKRTTGHRPLLRGLDYQNSSGCRGCATRSDLRALARAGSRRPSRTGVAAPPAGARDADRAHHGSRVRRRSNAPACSRTWLCPRGSAVEDPHSPVELRPRPLS